MEKAGFTVIETKANGGKWALCGQVMMHTMFPELKKSKRLKWRVFRLIFNTIGGVKSFNKFFMKLDDGSKDEINTINYVVIPKKIHNENLLTA